MVEASDTLKGLIEVGAHNLAVTATDSYMRPVSSEARSLDQKRVHMALIDEIHEHETALVVEKMRAGTKGDDTALIFEITNSGYDRHSICWQHHQYSRQVLAGTVPNDSWFAYIAAIDEGDDYTDERVWPKANPLLDVTVTRRYLREQVQEARDMPPKAALVAAAQLLRLDRGIGRRDRDGTLGRLRRAAADRRRCRPCYAGLDLSTTTDLTALVLLREDEDGYLDVLARFWCPAEGIALRSRRDHVPYELWARAGLDHPHRGQRHRLRRDPRGRSATSPTHVRHPRASPTTAGTPPSSSPSSSATARRWSRSGRATPRCQPRPRNGSARIAAGKVRHGGNPVLRWMAANLVVEQDAAGNLKPSKAKSTERIDGQVAAIMALARLTAPHEPPPREPGILGLWRQHGGRGRGAPSGAAAGAGRTGLRPPLPHAGRSIGVCGLRARSRGRAPGDVSAAGGPRPRRGGGGTAQAIMALACGWPLARRRATWPAPAGQR